MVEQIQFQTEISAQKLLWRLLIRKSHIICSPFLKQLLHLYIYRSLRSIRVHSHYTKQTQSKQTDTWRGKETNFAEHVGSVKSFEVRRRRSRPFFIFVVTLKI